MKKNLIIVLIAIIAVTVGVYNLSSEPTDNIAAFSDSNQQNQVTFSVDAKRWQFTPDIIRVKKGQNVKIIIKNTDAKHGINLPDFNVSGENSVEFMADKNGEFTFYCQNFCGQGHAAMTGIIIVTN